MPPACGKPDGPASSGMSLRLLEISVDAESAPDLRELLAEREVRLHSEGEGPEGRRIARVVVPVEKTEALTDALTDRFGSREAFGIVILEVEAVVPALEPAEGEVGEEAEPAAEDEEESTPSRISREELYQDVSSASQLTTVWLATVALSTVVAAAGLIRGDVAVIIGAMVIAPLLGPAVGFALGLTLGDLSLARLAAKSSVAGVAVAFSLSVLVGFAIPVDPTVEELASRTQVGLSDLAIAMAAGSAGSLAYTTGLPSAIIGVMVAVALLPPLVAAGLLLGAGDFQLAAGAAVLVLVNFTCVSLAAVATFFAQRVRPRTWWQEERAKKAMRVAVFSWLVLLAVLVGLIFLLDSDGRAIEEMTRPAAEEAGASEPATN